MLIGGVPSEGSLGGNASAGAAAVAALDGAALLLGETAPDTSVLAGFQGPLEAGRGNWAAVADQLGLSDLGESRAGVTDREEELRVFVAANSFVAPIHD